MDADTKPQFELDERDVEIITSRGSGPGGQHRNMTDSCVVAKHIPTGISAKIDYRSQSQSKQLALKILASRVENIQQEQWANDRDKKRKRQVGRGQRGDKRRTYRERDDQIVDHVTGKKWKFSRWMRGIWS